MNDSYELFVAKKAVQTLCDLIRAIDEGSIAAEGVGVDHLLKYADMDAEDMNWFQSLLKEILGDSSEESRVPS